MVLLSICDLSMTPVDWHRRAKVHPAKVRPAKVRPLKRAFMLCTD